MINIECVLDAKALLGESPVWSAEEQALYWADLLAPAIHRLDPVTGATRTWPMPETLGSFGLRESGGAVVALRSGFYTFDFNSGTLSFLAAPELTVAGTRFNDGKVSPDGRFFAGTMDEVSLSRPIGALYRLDPDGSLHQVLEGLIVSNGLGWSLDGRTLFHADSEGQVINAYDYDPDSGEIANQRLIARPSAEIGLPDGGAVDREGFYWSAGVSAGVLNRWAPDGSLDRQIPLPCTAPTMPCFGGPDLKILYVTSMTQGLSPAALAAKPLSGGIFALEVEVAGVPVAKFKG